MSFAIGPLPVASGAYRWYYADVTAGDWTAVGILLAGSVFSPRYAARLGRGGRPLEHCAVNLALYERGRRRAWVFSEYAGAVVEGGRVLGIGDSGLAYRPDGAIEMWIRDRTAPWRRAVAARLTLQPVCPPGPEVSVDGRRPHFWQPLAVRAHARLEVPALGLDVAGTGYHDTNHGAEPLGDALRGWHWTRVHGPRASWVRYRPDGVATAIHVEAAEGAVDLRRSLTPPAATHRTGWGLAVPDRLAAGTHALAVDHLLESSPFYARQEAAAAGVHALGEAADFRRFRAPHIRWMARFRMRVAA